MADVLQVLTALEGIQITKELLESTRLGKHINHLRRKTTNESLARRAKNLLRKWREEVLPSAGVAAAPSAPIIHPQISNPINSMPPTTMPVNGYGAQEHRSHPHQLSRGSGSSLSMPANTIMSLHHDSEFSGRNQQINHSNGNKKSANNSNRKFASGSSSGGGGGGGGSMPTNNYKYNNSVNIGADQLIVDPIDAGVQRKTVNNSKQRRNAGEPSTIAPMSDPYRFLQIRNESGESKSPINISALPKIPKKIPSSSSLTAAATAASSALNVNKNSDRSHSPFSLSSASNTIGGMKSHLSSPSSKWSSTPGVGYQQQQKLFSSITDDNTVHQYDMQHHGVKSAINGRDQNFYSLNSGDQPSSSFSLADNNSNSSSMRDRDVSRSGVPAVDQLSINERIITSEIKKKHKKNKKEKKKKRHSSPIPEKIVEPVVMIPAAVMPPIPSATRIAAAAPVVFELADSLSSSSMSLFNSTNNSVKVLPKTSVVGDNGGGGGSGGIGRCSSTIPPADLTFSGKFSKTEDVINIDSSSCSNSPKYAKLPSERSVSPLNAVPSRSSSPIHMKKLLSNRLAVIDEDSFGQSTSASAAVAVPATVAVSLPSPNNFVGKTLSQVRTITAYLSVPFI